MEIIAVPLIIFLLMIFVTSFFFTMKKRLVGMSDADYSDCRKCSPWLYADYRCHHSAHLKHCPGL